MNGRRPATDGRSLKKRYNGVIYTPVSVADNRRVAVVPVTRMRRFHRHVRCVLLAALVTTTAGAVQARVTVAHADENCTDCSFIVSRQAAVAEAIDGDRIRLLVWNVHKGRDDEWIGDFRTLAADSDLVLLQEAQLHPEFVDGLVGLARWDLVDAWQWRHQATGVLTGSDVEPVRVQGLASREPLLRLDKSALVTEYRIAGSDRTLLVANVHAINFTVPNGAFRAQLLAVADLLDEHDGPVILSGDLNTWREERSAIVHGIASALGLTEVEFNGPRRQFLRFPLDHVFYRDLDVLAADVPAVGSSDHNPLLVTFRLNAEER